MPKATAAASSTGRPAPHQQRRPASARPHHRRARHLRNRSRPASSCAKTPVDLAELIGDCGSAIASARAQAAGLDLVVEPVGRLADGHGRRAPVAPDRAQPADQCGEVHAARRPHRARRASTADGGIAVSVTDTGIGMKPEEIPARPRDVPSGRWRPDTPPRRAPGSACRWRERWSSCMAARSSSPARLAKAPPSPSPCRASA